MAKTIVEKLNLHKYEKVAVLNLPEGADYLSQLPDFDTALKDASYDLIFSFVLDMESLKAQVTQIIESNALSKNGYLFLAYPKKGNKVYPTFIHRDDLLEGLGADENGYVGSSGIKFARMVGLDDVFTVVGLKEDAGNRNKQSTAASQCVDDYIEMIPAIENDLRDEPELLALYQSLTPGYRKDWARFVYSAKQETTKEKRRKEMLTILAAGYKSRDLYQRSK
ncbi:YdeI/OmpD-associated family protein [Planococcus sp. N028]|uniref:YdeI/OmpD-associated family protein n=1 Tax=Planococcus shixiaomingii TaxID=3058393 RepID=A0ABT8N3N7_9BACL|nr:YdeI/OmpD-associated family protein [Planococcus sp. N028]MDN7242481.1 YdeI/OmpD-associated family protein [Planococcus sp. N028]